MAGVVVEEVIHLSISARMTASVCVSGCAVGRSWSKGCSLLRHGSSRSSVLFVT